MQLTTVKELFKEREKYLDKEITAVGSAASVIPRRSALSY